MDINYLEILEEIKEYGMYAFFYFISYCIFIIPLGIWTIVRFRRKEYFAPRISIAPRINKGFLALLISCIVVYGIADAYKRTFIDKTEGIGITLNVLIEAVIGMPSSFNSNRKSDLTKLLDQLNIPEEAWFKPTCKVKTKRLNESGSPYFEEYNLIECINLTGGDVLNDAMGCTGQNLEKCAGLEMDKFVLSRQDIFQKIIDVSRSPCKFIPTIEEAELIANSKGIKFNEIIWSIKSFRKDFECDKALWRRNLQTILIRFWPDKVIPTKLESMIIIKREE